MTAIAADRREAAVGMMAIADTRSAAMTGAIDRVGAAPAWIGWDEAVAQVETQSAAVILIDAQGVADAILSAALHRIDAAATRCEMQVVAALSDTQIDLVCGGLIGRNVTLLCAPDEAEWIAAITLARVAVDGVATAATVREGDSERLARVQGELARVIEVLARLSRDVAPEPSPPGSVADNPSRFAGQPASADIAADDVRRIIRARRLRDRFFGEGVFEDPAWDMILDLFASHLARAQVSVSSLCIAAAVAPTTALRWIAKLVEVGLFERRPDLSDRRRAFVALAPRGVEAMNRYVLALREAGLPLA